MTERSDPDSLTHSLLWVCAPWGWALGPVDSSEPWVTQPWPDGGVPQALPEFDWSMALARASADHPAPEGVLVHVWVSHGPEYPAPHWWPLTRASRQLWRNWLRSAGGRLGEVRQDHEADWHEDIWSAARTGWVADPPATSVWLRHSRSPWGQMLVSSLVVLALHVGLMQGVKPALMQHRAQERAQAEADWQAEQQKKIQQREAAQKAEHDKQLRDWQAKQSAGLKPLHQLERLLADAQAISQPQFWSELRHAEGAWTIFGVVSQEAAWHAAAQTLADWQPQTLESGVGLWAPPGSPAWPAWRFQVRLQGAIAHEEGP